MGPELLVVIAAVIAAGAGVIVWVRQSTNIINQSFFALCLSLALWMVTNAMFALLPQELQYVDALLSYAAAASIATFFLVFCLALVRGGKNSSVVMLGGVLAAFISALPGVLATGVKENSIETTLLIYPYGALIVSFFGYGLYLLLRNRKTASYNKRLQINAVLLGAFVAIVGGAFCNLLLPVLDIYRYVIFGPVFSLVFISTFTYSIIKHRLFDLRGAIIRSVAYLVLLAFLGITSGVVAYQLFLVVQDGKGQLLTFILISIGIAVAYGPAKRVIDIITKNLFFADEYDIQATIDQMTKIFSRASSEKRLIKETVSSLVSVLAADDIVILDSVPPELHGVLRYDSEGVLVRDYVEETPANMTMLDYLHSQRIAVVAVVRSEKKAIAYMLFKDKKNGVAYSPHDIQFIDVITDEFAIALQNVRRLESINEFNEELQGRIRDATGKLRMTNQKLRSLDHTKDEFISMASHQLRTPLTSIKGYISMVLEGDVGEINPQQRKMLEEAFASSQRMVYLIGDFLNVSRIQTGKFELERSDISLPNIISEEISQLKATAKSRGIELAYTAPADFPVMSIDENKIRQVMMNFIDNAIYYSTENTTITVSLAKFANRIEFKVIDQGIGVPKEAQQHLFTKFFRADNAKQQRPDGTGIGLFMAKKVIIEHGGAIMFESEQGKGSMFGFRLPFEPSKNTPSL